MNIKHKMSTEIRHQEKNPIHNWLNSEISILECNLLMSSAYCNIDIQAESEKITTIGSRSYSLANFVFSHFK